VLFVFFVASWFIREGAMVGTGRTLILPGVGFEARRLGRDVALMAGFSLLTAVSARFAMPLPFTPVPLTGQTFAVLLTGALLGGWRGWGAMLIYLVEGLAGLPVFAGNAPVHPGLGPLLGPTGGYLFAFPLAALIVGLLAERGWDRTPARALAAMAIGSLVIYALGAGWLSLFYGPLAAIEKGILPFLPGDALKAALAASLLPLGWRLTGPGKR
jgi:biotin transport system substrate-specific component